VFVEGRVCVNGSDDGRRHFPLDSIFSGAAVGLCGENRVKFTVGNGVDLETAFNGWNLST
jgi:hypothetical protein